MFETITQLIVHIFEMRLKGSLHFENYSTLIILLSNSQMSNTETRFHKENQSTTSNQQQTTKSHTNGKNKIDSITNGSNARSISTPHSQHRLDTLDSQELQIVFNKIFGLLQFHITGVPFNETSTTLKQTILNYNALNMSNFHPVLKNRMRRVTHWCFDTTDSQQESKNLQNTKTSTTCSDSTYSMYTQLSKLITANTKHSVPESYKDLNISELLAHIDLSQILHLPEGKSAKSYNSCLNTWDFCATELTPSELIQIGVNILYPLITNDYKDSSNSLQILQTQDIVSKENSSSSSSSSSSPSAPSASKSMSVSKNEVFLLMFIVECNYHQDNKFHNFKHAVDVLQASHYLFLQLVGESCKKSNPDSAQSSSISNHICACSKKELTSMLLLLSLSALGHDVGHPGTNNKIMQENTQMLQKFYENSADSILEKFHYKIFWNFLKDFPNILDNCYAGKHHINDIILATDMAKHYQYIEDLSTTNSCCSENLDGNNKCLSDLANCNKRSFSSLNIDSMHLSQNTQNSITTKNSCSVSESCHLSKNSLLVLELIVKAADISNVTRPLLISTKWAYLICLEFAECTKLTEQNEKYAEALAKADAAEAKAADAEAFAAEVCGNEDEAKEMKKVAERAASKARLEATEQTEKIKETSQSKNINTHRNSVTYSSSSSDDEDTDPEPDLMDQCLSLQPSIPQGQLFFIKTFAAELFSKLSAKFPQHFAFLEKNLNENRLFWEEYIKENEKK
ncbi:hypothetical protein ACO0QE_003868 [Hanseniaspora vineae]